MSVSDVLAVGEDPFAVAPRLDRPLGAHCIGEEVVHTVPFVDLDGRGVV